MINITSEKVVEPAFDNDEVVLSVEGVSKKFCRDLKRSLLYGVQDIAGDLTGVRRKGDRLRTKEFWALDNVSFQLKKGESIGLVGKNGSGKSTLLRIIAGLIKPDLGTVQVTGRVAPLIALGAGFNPILTGRENIYANMSILGLSTKEIEERFDDVVEFAEIGDAIDAPVQTYSSGMAARLGFSSAIHTEPEILLIDEVLAVGDVKFRGKCIRRLAKLREKGTSFIFVSHNSMAILAVSTSAVYLQKGRTLAVGSPEAIIQKYEEDLFINGKLTMPGSISIPEKDSAESSGVDLLNIYFQDREGNNIEELATGKFADCVVGFKAHEKFQDISVRAEIKEIGGEGETVLFLSSYLDLQTFDIDSGKHKIHLTMPYIGLKPGIYTMNLNIRKGSNYIFDTVESFRFVVKGDAATFKNAFYQPHSWEISN